MTVALLLLAAAQPPAIAVTNSSPQPTIPVADAVSAPSPIGSMVPPRVLQFDNVTNPRPRAPAQSYVNRDDYPIAALDAKMQGRVRVRLFVGPDGRVGGCLIVKSSGSAVLDAATCRLLQRRARFTPAMDRHGNPAAAPIEQEIEWRLP